VDGQKSKYSLCSNCQANLNEHLNNGKRNRILFTVGIINRSKSQAIAECIKEIDKEMESYTEEVSPNKRIISLWFVRLNYATINLKIVFKTLFRWFINEFN
jgi:hypothetical protein